MYNKKVDTDAQFLKVNKDPLKIEKLMRTDFSIMIYTTKHYIAGCIIQ